jgi:hypothetical protein
MCSKFPACLLVTCQGQSDLFMGVDTSDISRSKSWKRTAVIGKQSVRVLVNPQQFRRSNRRKVNIFASSVDSRSFSKSSLSRLKKFSHFHDLGHKDCGTESICT